MAETATRFGIGDPVPAFTLADTEGAVHEAPLADAPPLGAEVTPHVFVLDGEQRLAYRGAPDADQRDPSQAAGWLRAALDSVLSGRAVEPAETRARGCSVKWR